MKGNYSFKIFLRDLITSESCLVKFVRDCLNHPRRHPLNEARQRLVAHKPVLQCVISHWYRAKAFELDYSSGFILTQGSISFRAFPL